MSTVKAVTSAQHAAAGKPGEAGAGHPNSALGFLAELAEAIGVPDPGTGTAGSDLGDPTGSGQGGQSGQSGQQAAGPDPAELLAAALAMSPTALQAALAEAQAAVTTATPAGPERPGESTHFTTLTPSRAAGFATSAFATSAVTTTAVATSAIAVATDLPAALAELQAGLQAALQARPATPAGPAPTAPAQPARATPASGPAASSTPATLPTSTVPVPVTTAPATAPAPSPATTSAAVPNTAQQNAGQQSAGQDPTPQDPGHAGTHGQPQPQQPAPLVAQQAQPSTTALPTTSAPATVPAVGRPAQATATPRSVTALAQTTRPSPAAAASAASTASSPTAVVPATSVTIGSTPVPTGTATAGTTTTAVVQQVFPEVTRLAGAGNGTHRLVITLHPESLGEVRVTVVVRGDNVRVSLNASSESSQALDDGVPELQRMLAQLGHGDATVTVRDASTAGAAAGSGAQQQPGTQQQNGQQQQPQQQSFTTSFTGGDASAGNGQHGAGYGPGQGGQTPDLPAAPPGDPSPLAAGDGPPARTVQSRPGGVDQLI